MSGRNKLDMLSTAVQNTGAIRPNQHSRDRRGLVAGNRQHFDKGQLMIWTTLRQVSHLAVALSVSCTIANLARAGVTFTNPTAWISYDSDSDGLPNVIDNAPSVSNPSQQDSDNDQ